jgi:hypothetical protein
LKGKIWIFIILVAIIIFQLAAISSFFHPFQAGGMAYNTSIVEVSKQEYVFGWASFSIQGATAQYPITLEFQNGSKMNVTSDYTFSVRLPRTGDCYCQAGTGLYETNVSIDESTPIAAAVLDNASTFEIQEIPTNSSVAGFVFNTYWFLVIGYGSVSINGYGVAY